MKTPPPTPSPKRRGRAHEKSEVLAIRRADRETPRRHGLPVSSRRIGVSGRGSVRQRNNRLTGFPEPAQERVGRRPKRSRAGFRYQGERFVRSPDTTVANLCPHSSCPLSVWPTGGPGPPRQHDACSIATHLSKPPDCGFSMTPRLRSASTYTLAGGLRHPPLALLGVHANRQRRARTTLPHEDDDGLKTSIRSWLRPFVSSPNRGRKRAIRNCNPH